MVSLGCQTVFREILRKEADCKNFLGGWFRYGQQPTKFLESWKKVTDIVRAAVTDKHLLALVWAPNAVSHIYTPTNHLHDKKQTIFPYSSPTATPTPAENTLSTTPAPTGPWSTPTVTAF